jgi:hypothetical protein
LRHLVRHRWAIVTAITSILAVAPRTPAQQIVARLPPPSLPSALGNVYSSGPSGLLRDAPITPYPVNSNDRLADVPTITSAPSQAEIADRVYTSPNYLAAFSRRQPKSNAGTSTSNDSIRADSDENGNDDDSWPNISEPGPDMGDFPNSAFTLPKGGAQAEFSPVTLLKADRQNPNAYVTPFLLRYGLTDNVEFRLLGFGLTSVSGPSPTTGIGPPKLDMKVHLWNSRKQWLLPAASLEVYVTTAWGSRPFNSGWQPSINMNFDFPITKKLNLEWTVGYSGVRQGINVNTGEVFVPRFGFLVPGIHRAFNLNFDQFSASWAFEYEVSERLAFFFHGAHNGAIALNLGGGDIIGQGVFWKFNRRLIGFGSINEGLTPNLPPVAAQVGFAYAL